MVCCTSPSGIGFEDNHEKDITDLIFNSPSNPPSFFKSRKKQDIDGDTPLMSEKMYHIAKEVSNRENILLLR